MQTKIDSVIDFVGNAGFYFDSSNSLLDGKKIVFSMAKPFDLIIKNRDCVEWWVIRDSNPRPPRCKRDALAN